VAADVEVALRQQSQHLAVIDGLDRAQHRCSQRGDRDRQRVVRVVLVGPARTEQTHSRRQRRGDVHDRLAGVDELLSEQIPQPRRGLDRPGPFCERRGPRQQLRDLLAGRADLDVPELAFVAADGDGCVRRLVRVDTDHHCHVFLRGLVDGTAKGTPGSDR